MTKARDLAGFASSAVTTTASDGLVLKGDGSTTDVIIKNGANATVAKIADGSTDLSKVLARGAIDVGNSSGVSVPLAIGTNGYFLKSNGSDAAWGEVVGSDSRQNYVADGTIGARAGVFLNGLGKVSASPSFIESDHDTVINRTNVRTNSNPAYYSGCGSCSAYSTSANKTVSVHKVFASTTAVNTQYVVTTTNAAGEMSHSTPVNFNPSSFPNIQSMNMQYNANINRFVVCFSCRSSAGQDTNKKTGIAIGTLNAANDTVAWTFGTITMGTANPYTGWTYTARSSPHRTCTFAISTDGSNLVITGVFRYSGTVTQTAVVKACSINAGNNTFSQGAWHVLQVGGSNNGYTSGGSDIYFHDTTSQYLVSVTTTEGGTSLKSFLGTVSGNTFSQSGNSTRLTNELTGNYMHQTTWRELNSTTLVGCSFNGTDKIVFKKLTIGANSLSNYSETIHTIKDSEFVTSPLTYWSGGGNQGMPIVVGTSWHMAWTAGGPNGPGQNTTDKWYIKMVYDTANIGLITTVLHKNELATDGDNTIYPRGGPCWAYDTQRGHLIGIGSNCEPQTAQSLNLPIVAASINVGALGTGPNPLGLHDSGSSASDGATVSVAQLGSLVTGFSGLQIGENLLANTKVIGKATSATTVFVTANTNGAG